MARALPRQDIEPVAAYKRLLATIIDRRPSGTRLRLATALAKNRSFVSQITNPAYATPIPVAHLEIIFELCHFSAPEKRQFMDLYHAAHPRRLALVEDRGRLKPCTVYLPDLGGDARNEALHGLVAGFVRQLARLIEDQPARRKRK